MNKNEGKQLSNNLNFLLLREGISPAKLARDVSLPAATIQNLRYGDNTNPTLSTLVPLAKYFSVTVSQLIGEIPINENESNLASYLKNIPILSWEAAQLWPKVEKDKFKSILVENYSAPIDFALINSEKSLKDFPENSFLLISHTVQPKHNDFVIVYKTGQPKAILRQWIDEGDGEVYLRSLVVGYPLICYNSKYHIIGIVSELKKIFFVTTRP